VLGPDVAGLFPVRAPPAPRIGANCDVPAYLLATESQLPKVAEAIKRGNPLEILWGQPFGSRAMHRIRSHITSWLLASHALAG